MKIQKLTIHNIASIEDAVIDFEQSPLSDSELFLITGKTGSGKSTVLDAICLALYASTPRLEGTRIQGSTKDKDQKITVSDPRQLLRRNKGEGFVRLSFTGTDRVPYEAEWSVRRAREKVDGNLQAKTWTLKDLSSNKVYTKDNDIRSVMANAIGLTFEQFCRTTMLAQGEFTRFLNSEDKDKAAILEKITGVNIYSEIGSSIYAITAEKEALYKESMLKAESVCIPSEEVIARLQESAAKARDEYKELETMRQKAAGKLAWMEKHDAVLARISEAQLAVNVANERTASDEYRKDEATVVDWNSSEEARESHVTLMTLRSERARLDNVFARHKARYEALLGAYAWEAEHIRSLSDTLAEYHSELAVSERYKALYLNERITTAHLRVYASALVGISEGRNKLKKLLKMQQESSGRRERAVEIRDKAVQAMVDAEYDLKAADKAFADYDLPSYRKSSADINARLAILTAVTVEMDKYTVALTNYNEAETRVAVLMQDTASLKEQVSVLSMQLPAAESARNVVAEVCERQKAGIDDWAKAIRASLSLGDECPVCRHRVEFLPSEEEMNKLYAVAYEAYQAAQKTLEDLQAAYNKAAAELKAFESQMSNAQTYLKQQSDAVQLRRNALVGALENVDLVLADGIEKVVDEMLSEAKTSLEDIMSKINEGEAMERSVTLKRNEFDRLRTEWDKAQASLDVVEAELAGVTQLINTAEAVIAEKMNQADETVSNLKGIIGDADCIDIDWQKAPDAYATELQSLAGKYVALQERAKAADQDLQLRKSEYGALTDIVMQIAREITEWADLKAGVKNAMREPLKEANSILAETRSCFGQIIETERRIAGCNDVIRRFLMSQSQIDGVRLAELASMTTAQISLLNARLESARTAVIAAKGILSEHKKTEEDLLKTMPVFEEEETKDRLMSICAQYTENQKRLSEETGAIEQKLQQIADDKERVGHLQQEMNERRSEWEKWNRLNVHFGDSTGAKFRKIAQSYVLANLIKAANVYMATLTDRYTLKVEPGEFVIMVEDAYQCCTQRAASTISGGESFLVSLSLALALSDIGHTLAVDILFIDEGFGTLSGEPLTNAINTLKTLHRKSGRKVGIISHVEELKEKIPVQIQVQQDGNSSKSTIRIV